MDQSTRLLSETGLGQFKQAYPYTPAKISHEFAGHPLLEIDRLVALSKALPPHCLEYQRGDIDIDQRDQRQIPKSGLTFEDTLRNISESGSWACLRNIEHDPDCKALMNSFISQLEPVVHPATGKIYKPECYIVLASPHSITPFHFDPQHVMLVQVQGTKEFALFPADDEALVSPEQHETYHHVGESNLEYDPAIAEPRATIVDMGPGDAVYIPVKSPHWVRTGPEVSVAINISWRSNMSDRQRQVYIVNRQLRKVGFNPGLAGKSAVLDQTKSLAYRVYNRLAPQ